VTRSDLRALAHDLLRAELGALCVGRLCPRCGSPDHGRPYVVVPGAAAPQVSLAYADGLVAVAWADGPAGIDVEDDGPPVDGVARRAFSAAEARFKADGETSPSEIEVPEGYVGFVAGAGVSWRLAGPAAPRH
jgi:phosphopantetheinyl transferase